MRLRRHLAVLVLGVATALTAHAAVDPSLYQGLSWRLIGPFRSGRVLTVAGIAGDSRHFYFGAVDVEDARAVWQPMSP